MWNLAVRFSPFTGDISESVAAEHCARVHDHALAQRGPCVQRHAREELGLVAHRHALAQHAPRPDAHVAPQLHAASEDRVRADFDRLLPCRAPANDGRRMNARLPHRLGIEHGQDDEQRGVRLVHDDACFGTAGGRFESGRDEHHRRAGALKVGDIPRRGKKREIAGPRPLEGRDPGDRDAARAHQPAARQRGDFTRGQRPGARRVHDGARPVTAPAGGAAAPEP